jgi:hypothetical protein
VTEIPDLKWVPNIGVYERMDDGWYPMEAYGLRPANLPADAVQLGNVKALRELLERTMLSRDNHMNRAIRVERILDEIRAVLNSQRLIGMGDQDYAIARVRDILGGDQ